MLFKLGYVMFCPGKVMCMSGSHVIWHLPHEAQSVRLSAYVCMAKNEALEAHEDRHSSAKNRENILP